MVAFINESWTGIDVGQHLSLFAPELALVATMLAVVSAPVLLGRGARVVGTVATLGVLSALLLVWQGAGLHQSGGGGALSTDPGSTLLIADRFGSFFKLILMVFLVGVTLMWWMGSSRGERDAPEFFVLLLGSALGMALMASTTNLLMMVIAIETASMPSYAMVGFDKRNPKGAEAALKYMVFGAICAATMVYGASILYGLTGGSLEMADAAKMWFSTLGSSNRLLASIALLCVMVGIAFKISAVPAHFWCPDAFEGARIEVTTWLSVVSKAAGLVLLMRLVHVFCVAAGMESGDMWRVGWHRLAPLGWAVGLTSIITCTWANFAAYRQSNVKRMLAYSSIAHAGYMLMAGAVFLSPAASDSYAATSALLVYVVVYLFMNLGAFGVVAMVGWRTGSDDLEAFSGLIRRAPMLAVPMIICLVSLVGLPPFAGFLGKWWILVALGRQGTLLSWVLVVAAAANTLFSLYYYMRIVVQMTLRDAGRPAIAPPLGGLMMVNVCAAALIGLFVAIGPLKSAADRYAAGMFVPRASGTLAGMPSSNTSLAERAP